MIPFDVPAPPTVPVHFRITVPLNVSAGVLYVVSSENNAESVTKVAIALWVVAPVLMIVHFISRLPQAGSTNGQLSCNSVAPKNIFISLLSPFAANVPNAVISR